MRFKSRMAIEHLQLLHNVIVPISRLTGSSDGKSIGSGTTIYIDPEVMRISARGGAGRTVDDSGAGEQGSEGIACFSELIAVNGIFLEHKIESIADNVIVFDMSLSLLLTSKIDDDVERHLIGAVCAATVHFCCNGDVELEE